MYHQQHQHQGTAAAGGGRGRHASSTLSRISHDGNATIGSSSGHHSLSGLSAISVGSSVGMVKLPAQGILRLHVIRAESLTHVHLSPTTGPYLAIAYGKTRHKTRINNVGGVNPQWNECFELYVSSSDVRKQSVLFTVKNKKVTSNGRGGGGGGAEGDNRSIISAISSASSGGGSSILGVANVKLISLCAKERTLLIPLRRVGSSKPAGCIKVRVSFEAWRAGRAAGSLSSGGVGNTMDLRGGATPAGNPVMVNSVSHQSLQRHAKQQLMMMPQQPPTRRPMQNPMMDMDQRDDYGPVTPLPPPPPRPPMPASAARAPARSGLPPLGPSSTGRHGGYYQLEESFEDMEVVDANSAHRRSGAEKSPKDYGPGSRHNSSPNRHRGGGGNRRRERGRGCERRDQHRSGRRRGDHRRDRDRHDDRDDSTARRDDVPSIVDCYDVDDDDHSAIDESEFCIDRRGGGRILEQEDSWERVKVARPRVSGNPRDALVSTSKFLCF